MRMPRPGLLATLRSGMCALAAAAPPTLADCDGADAAPARTAATAPEVPPRDARALWLDGRLIRWPGAPGGGRYRLYHSAQARLQATPGEALQGADGALLLEDPARALPPAVATRFRHGGPGATLSAAAPDLPRLRALLRQQIMLVREDAAGQVLDATQLQLPGALYALYAKAGALRDLGAKVRRDRRPARTAWRLWAPTAQRVHLCLYPSATGAAEALAPLKPDARTGSWAVQRAGDLGGRAYTYLVDVVVPGGGVVRNRVTHPYSLSQTPGTQLSRVRRALGSCARCRQAARG